MQERRHVKTTPGEPHAVPEYTPHPVRRQEGKDVQMDDINIPLLSVIVAFFGILIAVTIVGLQAWFYNYQTAERELKHVPYDDPSTSGGALIHQQRDELGTAGPARMPPTTGPASANTQQQPKLRIPIQDAMKLVEKNYAQRPGGQN